jgi:hypothetical protein
MSRRSPPLRMKMREAPLECGGSTPPWNWVRHKLKAAPSRRTPRRLRRTLLPDIFMGVENRVPKNIDNGRFLAACGFSLGLRSGRLCKVEASE